MSTAPQTQAPSPAIIFDTLNSYQRSRALVAGIDLDVFTAIAEGNTTAAKIAARVQASERGTRILCDYSDHHRLSYQVRRRVRPHAGLGNIPQSQIARLHGLGEGLPDRPGVHEGI